MSSFLWQMRPYFRQVAGQLVLGSIAGIIMNTAVVLPAILLGQAIDAALAFERGEVGAGAVGWAALVFIGGTLLTEVPRDPFDGQPLRFRRSNGRFLIYSVGEDRTDDGGKVEWSSYKPGMDYGFQLWDVAKRRQPARADGGEK